MLSRTFFQDTVCILVNLATFGSSHLETVSTFSLPTNHRVCFANAILGTDLKRNHMPVNMSESHSCYRHGILRELYIAEDHSQWRQIVQRGIRHQIEHLTEKGQHKESKTAATLVPSAFWRDMCNKDCHSMIGLCSHSVHCILDLFTFKQMMVSSRD